MKGKYYIVVDEKTGGYITASSIFFVIHAHAPASTVLHIHPDTDKARRNSNNAPVDIDAKQADRWAHTRPAVMTRSAATELIANYKKYIRGDYLVKNGNQTRPALRMIRVIVHGEKLGKYIRY